MMECTKNVSVPMRHVVDSFGVNLSHRPLRGAIRGGGGGGGAIPR